MEYDIDETSSNDILREIIGLGFAAEVKIECARRKQFAYISLSRKRVFISSKNHQKIVKVAKRENKIPIVKHL